jgi:hypothetical protein
VPNLKQAIIAKVFHRILDITELDFYPALSILSITTTPQIEIADKTERTITLRIR